MLIMSDAEHSLAERMAREVGTVLTVAELSMLSGAGVGAMDADIIAVALAWVKQVGSLGDMAANFRD